MVKKQLGVSYYVHDVDYLESLVAGFNRTSIWFNRRLYRPKKGFKDLEVNMTGGHDPNTTALDSPFVKPEEAVYKKYGIDPIVWPRQAGSWPSYIFTNEPLKFCCRSLWPRPRKRRTCPE